MKIKDVFKSQRAVKITILVVTLMIVFGLVKLIYFFDQPKFIPEETRGKVREGVNEEVVKPLEKVIPPLAKAISNAAYKSPASGGQTGSSGTSGSSGTTDTSNWQTYKNDKYGYEIKYPEDYFFTETSAGTLIASNEYRGWQATYPLISIEVHDNAGSQSVESWTENNSRLFIGDQNPKDVEGFNDKKHIKVGQDNAIEFTYQSMGEIKATVVAHNNKIIVLEVYTISAFEGNLADVYKSVLSSLKF